MSELHGYFITGTDTGVGKTMVTRGLMQLLQDRGHRVAGMKPVAVIAAKKRIRAGTPVTRAMLTQKMVPERDLP